jgi:hypothetical protein
VPPKPFPALCQNCLKKLFQHLAIIASKNFPCTLTKLPLKTMQALLKMPLFKTLLALLQTAEKYFSRHDLMQHFSFCL